ncbi:hypothetical protein Tco_1044714 [Tanacetum coccineum]|uniref:Uncharacterized protein n=1 Tax=Tanacetum coccineum TaxID=301880 RepID=A0ABQ5GRU4_9ASTR
MAERPNLDEDKGGKLIDPTRFRGMVGSLMYLSASRPDIVFAVCMCARYQAKPTEMHLTAIKRIFRMLTMAGCHWTHGECSQHSRSSTLISQSPLSSKSRVEREKRFATLLPLLGVKQMSPGTLKELQDESVLRSRNNQLPYKLMTDCSFIPVWLPLISEKSMSSSNATVQMGRVRRYIIKAFKDSNRYEHVRLKISVLAKSKRKEDHKVIHEEEKLNYSQ